MAVSLLNQADITSIALAPYLHKVFMPASRRCEESLAKDEAHGFFRICSMLAAHHADRCHRQATSATILVQGTNKESRVLVGHFAV